MMRHPSRHCVLVGLIAGAALLLGCGGAPEPSQGVPPAQGINPDATYAPVQTAPMDQGLRDRVARALADMRSMATAVEAFAVDAGHFPASVEGANPQSVAQGDPLLRDMPTLSTRESLTTPVAYLSALFADPFNPHGSTFSYWQDGRGWILVSPGPDGVFDSNPARDYQGDIRQPSARLVSLIYDPTNGETSGGDLMYWRW
jgi:hypothetical protein